MVTPPRLDPDQFLWRQVLRLNQPSAGHRVLRQGPARSANLAQYRQLDTPAGHSLHLPRHTSRTTETLAHPPPLHGLQGRWGGACSAQGCSSSCDVCRTVYHHGLDNITIETPSDRDDSFYLAAPLPRSSKRRKTALRKQRWRQHARRTHCRARLAVIRGRS